jgi:hypothetical protein
MPNMKKKFNFFYYTQTLINDWITYLTQYIQRKKVIPWLESPIQSKGSKFNPIFKFSFSSINEMDEKITSKQLFKLDAMGKESCFFPLGKRGLSCLFLQRKGTKLLFPLGRRGVAISPRDKATPFIPREKGIKLL